MTALLVILTVGFWLWTLWFAVNFGCGMEREEQRIAEAIRAGRLGEM